MEFWEVYDKNREKKNRTMVRGQKIEPGDYHLVVHVCLFNTSGMMLIQKRQPFKDGWPGLWDLTVGGSALEGETSEQAAKRESFEEIGLSYDFSNTRPHFTVNFSFGFDDYYLIEQDLDINLLLLQAEEVEAVQWASETDIIRRIDEGTFIPYHKSLIKLLFDTRKHYGAILK